MSLSLSLLAAFIGGMVFWHFALLWFAQRHVRVTYEPGCEKCGTEATLMVLEHASCFQCILDDTDVATRERTEEIARIQRNTDENVAKIKRELAADLARMEREHEEEHRDEH